MNEMVINGVRILYNGKLSRSFDISDIEEYYILNNYGRGVMIVPSGANVFDVGAFRGYYAMRIKELRPDLNIYCFEPNLENFDILKKNIENNGFNIRAFNCAITPKCGKYGLSKPSHDGSYVVDGSGDYVEGVTLEDAKRVAGVDRIHYLKMDIEGGEADLIKSIPSNIFDELLGVDMEFHPDSYPREEVKNIIKLLNSYGLNTVRHPDFMGPKMEFYRVLEKTVK